MTRTQSSDAKLRILFADDEQNLQELMRKELPRMGHSVTVCPDGLTALAAIEKESFDCMLMDIDMPGMTGIEVIEKAKEIRPEIVAVVMTGNPTQQSAISALRSHVLDYLTKPTRLADVKMLLQRVAEHRQIKRLIAALQHRIRLAEGGSDLVGSGKEMAVIKKLIQKVAPTDSSVLIRGETGCGKELVARAIHEASLRADHPLVPVNCGALPENLIESELFGHCKGAFTGADSARTGLFEVAQGGTIFLDEIGELPLAMQAKLLRVLETGDIRRLGDTDTVNVDVRVVCATHRDLEQMVQEGTFREDLMFRINTFEILVPPLRQRTEDIAVLASHLLRRHRSDGTDAGLFTAEAMEQFLAHSWPGNVRELANVVEHAAILCEALPIDTDHLPQHFRRRKLRKEILEAGPMTLREIELVAIKRAIERNDGNKPAAAEELGVSLKTLYNRIKPEEKPRVA